MVPGDKPDEKNFRDLESMPVRVDHHQPGQRHEARRRHARGQAARRRLGRRLRGQGGRRVDRFRRDLAAAKLDKPKNKYDWQRWTASVKLPSDGYYEIWTRGDGFARHHAAAHRGQLEPAGLRRQPDAPGRGAGRLMIRDPGHRRAGARAWSRAPARRAIAFTPSEETPEQFPTGVGRDETFYACTACHNFKLVAAQGMNAPAMGGFARLDDAAAQHAAARGQGAQSRARLSRGDVSAARAGAPGGWRNPFSKQ